jgi:hypothetical protein
MDQLNRWQKLRGYNVGKKGGAFLFGINLVVATLVVDSRFFL